MADIVPVIGKLLNISEKAIEFYRSISTDKNIRMLNNFFFGTKEEYDNAKKEIKDKFHKSNDKEFIEDVLIYLDGFKDIKKAEWVGKLFFNVSVGVLNKYEFLDYVELIDNTFVYDIIFLKDYLEKVQYKRDMIEFDLNYENIDKESQVVQVGPDPELYLNYKKFIMDQDEDKLIRCYRLESLGLLRQQDEIKFIEDRPVMQNKNNKIFIINNYAKKLLGILF